MVFSYPAQKTPAVYTCSMHYPAGFPGGSAGKESACSVGDPDLIPGSGRSPGEGNGNPLQCSCWESIMDRGAWWATVHGVAKNAIPRTPARRNHQR